MRKLMLAAAIAALPFSAIAADDDLMGTYKLVSEQRKIVDTGEIVSMPDSLGYISYGKDGRMLVLIVRSGRPKPESVDKLTDQQRADLFRTMISYGGTYKFDGNKVEHHADIGGVGRVCRKRIPHPRADDRKGVPCPLHMDRAFENV